MRPWQALVLTLALSCAGWSAAARASDVAEPATTLAAPADEAPPATRSYRVDPKQSALWVTVYADRSALASRFAHDHAIAATDYTGRVTWPTSDPSLCSVSFDVPVRSLWPDPPGFRERAGIDPDDSVGDPAKRTIVDNMLGKHQLDAAHHPTITFRSQRCDGVAGQVRITGDLTIRGVTRSVTVPLQIRADEGILTARGTFEVLHSDFGMEPFSNVGGLVRNAQKLTFGLDLKAVPAE